MKKEYEIVIKTKDYSRVVFSFGKISDALAFAEDCIEHAPDGSEICLTKVNKEDANNDDAA